MNYRLLIAGGGTGGHIFPGLTIAQALRSQGWQVEWLGTPQGLESQLVPREGIPLHYLSVSGLRGKGGWVWFKAPFQLLKALFQALKIIRHFQPHVVLGVGGFVSGPGGLAAVLKGIPLLIQEQNAIPGTTNRCLAPFATGIFEGFPQSFKGGHRAQIQWSGNPVRETLFNLPSPADRFRHRQGPLKLLVIGGSRGARVLNEQLPLALHTLPESLRPLIWHQTGEAGLQACQHLYAAQGISARIEAFIDAMDQAYAWADLVLCRAGALTIAELSTVGVASLLVPFPFAIDNHQWHNAAFLAAAGGAVILRESDLNTQSLAAQLSALLSDPVRLTQMAQAAYAVSKRDTVALITHRCKEVAQHVVK